MFKISRNAMLNFGMLASTGCVLALLAYDVPRAWDYFFPEEREPVTKRVSDWARFSEAGHRVGPADPVVTIVEFSDFECPFCAMQTPIIRAIREKYPDDIALVYRHFPGGGHEFARPAAVASECAARENKFFEYHDWLFQRTDSLDTVSWTALAERVGIVDIESFAECLDDPLVASVIDRDLSAAAELEVFATPTLLINDLAVAGFSEEQELEAFVLAALAASREEQ